MICRKKHACDRLRCNVVWPVCVATTLIVVFIGVSTYSVYAAPPISQRHYIVSDYTQGVIRRYDLNGEYIDDFATELGTSAELEIGPDGVLYVSSSTARGILKFDLHTAEPLGIVTTAGFSPRGFTWGPNGNLFAARASRSVLEFDPATEMLVNEFIPNVESPTALQFSSDGFVYVARGSLGGISRIDQFDALSGDFVSVLSDTVVNMPTDLLILPNGSMYVTNQGPGEVLTITKVQRPTGLADPSFQPDFDFRNPVAIKSFFDGELLVVDSLSGIVRLDATTGKSPGFLINDPMRLTSVADIVLVVPEPSTCVLVLILFSMGYYTSRRYRRT